MPAGWLSTLFPLLLMPGGSRGKRYNLPGYKWVWGVLSLRRSYELHQSQSGFPMRSVSSRLWWNPRPWLLRRVLLRGLSEANVPRYRRVPHWILPMPWSFHLHKWDCELNISNVENHIWFKYKNCLKN